MNLDVMEMRDDQEVNVLDHILGPSEVHDEFSIDNHNIRHSDDESHEVAIPKTKRKQVNKHASDQVTVSSSKKSKRSVDQKSKSSSSGKKTKSHSGTAHVENSKTKKSKDSRVPTDDDDIIKMRRELAQHNEAVKHTLSRLTALEKEFSKRSSDAGANRAEIDFPQSAELEALRSDMKKFEEMGQAQMAQMASLRRRNSGSDENGPSNATDVDEQVDSAAIVDVHARPSEEFESAGGPAANRGELLHLDSSDNVAHQDSGDERESAIGTVVSARKRAISPIEWDRKSEDEEEPASADVKTGAAGDSSGKDAAKSDKDIEIDLILEPVRELSPQPIKRVRREEYAATAPPAAFSGYETQSVSPPPRQPPSLAHLFKETRYFMIKSNNYENVSLAKAKKVWSTPHGNEARLNQAYYENRNVLLIFSVKESGKFQGYARLAGPSDHRGPRIHWSLPPNMNPRMLSGVFPLDWISRKDLSFAKTQHLHNAWNENKPVKIGRDGQEIEPVCGEALCRSFPVDDNCDLDEIVHKSRSAARRRQRGGPTGSAVTMSGSSAAAAAAAVAAAANYNAAARARVGDDRRAFPVNPYRARRRDYDDRQAPVGWGSSAAAVAAAAANVASGGYRDHHGSARSDHHRTAVQRIRSRSPGTAPSSHHHSSGSASSVYRGVNRDLLLNGDYQDYLRHQTVRRGYQYYNYPGYGGSAGLSYDPSAYQNAQSAVESYSDKDQKYEQRVSEFLKGIVHREKESSRRRRSRSRTPTRMRGGMNGPRTPSPRSRSRSRDRR